MTSLRYRQNHLNLLLMQLSVLTEKTNLLSILLRYDSELSGKLIEILSLLSDIE